MWCHKWKNNQLDHWHGKVEQEVKLAKFNGWLMAARASEQQRLSKQARLSESEQQEKYCKKVIVVSVWVMMLKMFSNRQCSWVRTLIPWASVLLCPCPFHSLHQTPVHWLHCQNSSSSTAHWGLSSLPSWQSSSLSFGQYWEAHHHHHHHW